MIVNPTLYLFGLGTRRLGEDVMPVFVIEGGSGQDHAHLTCPLALITPSVDIAKLNVGLTLLITFIKAMKSISV